MQQPTPASSTETCLPPSIRRLVERGIQSLDPTKVILFGSRATGNARADSDYDLAFVFPPENHGRWLRFLADLDDNAVTLLPVDLVAWTEAPESLRNVIETEGTVLYERIANR
jgi:predicted nucleotidyltransferase